jgi:DNA-binding IclR family transcriptional regulator
MKLVRDTGRGRRARQGAYRVQVLDRALAIIDALAEGSDVAPSEIGSRLRLHKSTIHRLLAVLERYEYIDRNLLNGRYSLGMRLVELGTRASARLDLSLSCRAPCWTG